MINNEIKKLAESKNAVILAHYYCRPEIHQVADFVGDSLALSQEAAASKAEVIVFSGVHFMAETASILCPEKTVLLVNEKAGCPMADMITAEELREFKEEHPGLPVVTYVNSSAEVKAESDICCTSANVLSVVKSLPDKKIIMTPDKNLAKYTQTLIPEKEIIYWPGCCHVHDNIKLSEVKELKQLHPEAIVMAHPECPPEILALADEIYSTRGILDYCFKSKFKEFIILTEEGILYPLKVNNPEKVFYAPKTAMLCPNMKKNRLEDVKNVLERFDTVVKVPEDIRLKAFKAVEKMLAVPRN